MKLKFKTQFAVISTATILTLILTWLVVYNTEQEMRNALLQHTQIGVNSIAVNHVKNLTGTAADLKLPDYFRLKQQFASILKADKDMHFVYLMGVKKNGKVFFYVDERQDVHPEGSPPGRPYDEAPKEFVQVMQTGISVAVGPYSNKWGSFVSGCVPVIDPKTGKTIAIFAIDFDTRSWYWTIVSQAALPVGLIIVLILELLSTLVSYRKNELLKNSEERFRNIFDFSVVGKSMTLLDGTLKTNKAFCDILGYSEDELKEMKWQKITHSDDIENDTKIINAIISGEKLNARWGKRYIHKNGNIVWVDISMILLRDNKGVPLHFITSITDITERVQAEDSLRKSELALIEAQKIAHIGNWEYDIATDKLTWSKQMFDLFGRDLNLGAPSWLEHQTSIHPDDWENLNTAVTAKAPFSIVFRLLHPTMGIRWAWTLGEPVIDNDGTTVMLRGTVQDITERKQAEAEIKTIFDTMLDGFCLIDMEGRILETNDSYCSMIGYSREELLTMKIKDIEADDDEEEIKKHIQRILESGYDRFETRHRHKDDRVLAIEVSVKFLIKEQPKLFCFLRNVTEQRKAEAELRKLSIAIEQSPNASCITDPNGIIEYVNPVSIELTGYTQEEMLGQKTSIFSSGEKPKEEYAELWKTIKSGNIWKGELHNKTKNGELYWQSTTISPIFDNQGRITNFLAIEVDISEQKRVEKALLDSKEQLRKFASHLQHIREEEKIALAREIHDDLGQLLVALKIDISMLKNKVIKIIPSSVASEIQLGFDNLVDLTSNTIKTARGIMNGLRPELLEQQGLVGAAKEYLREFEERHRISCEFVDDISNMVMSPQQSLSLFRILQEATNNIVKHAQASLVKIKLQHSDNKVIMKITDNGVGFDINNSGRNDSYGMIGMKERVIMLEGKLDITSEVGQGTSIKVEMPYIN